MKTEQIKMERKEDLELKNWAIKAFADVRKKPSELIGAYTNGNFRVAIGTDGTKIRETIDPNATEWLPEFPESLDVHLSNRCDNVCEFCYAGCTPNGKEAAVYPVPIFFDTIHPFTELALNINSRFVPGFEQFLKYLKDREIIANITIHQRQFMDTEMANCLQTWTDNNFIKGIGISVEKITEEFIERVKLFPNAVLHIIAGITEIELLERLKNKNLKVLVLGYKYIGRGKDYYDDITDSTLCTLSGANKINAGITRLKDKLKEMMTWFKVISFDNLALEQLSVMSVLPEKIWKSFYMGDDGHFTFFINCADKFYARNSLASGDETYTLKDDVQEMFQHVRNLKK